MSKKFTNVDTYSATPDQVWAMVTDKAYWEAKYAATGATNLQWRNFNADSDSLTLSTVRDVAATVPKVAQKLIGETAQVTQTEKWTRNGDELTSEVEIVTKGAPGGTTGTTTVKPSPEGSTWSADMDIKVPVPLLGGKLEGIMHEEMGKGFADEKVFNEQWLASH